MSVLADIYRKLFALKNHGTHVSSSTCVTSVNGQTGAVTVSDGASIPSGMICWFNLTSAPSGWVVCDGTNGTPNLIGKYPLGATSNIGTDVPAGLPPFDGVMYTHKHGTANINDTADTNRPIATRVNFNATDDRYREPVVFQSTTGGVYGSSDTVTPPSVKLLPCMKI